MMTLKNVWKVTGTAVLSLGVLAGCSDDAASDEEELTEADVEEFYTEEELNNWAEENGYINEEELTTWAEENGILDHGDKVPKGEGDTITDNEEQTNG